MAVQGVSIALSTEDVARSVKFYVEQLGFTCTLQLDGFARVRLSAANIMLALPNAHVPWQGPRFTGSIYLDVDNVDQLWERLISGLTPLGAQHGRGRFIRPNRASSANIIRKGRPWAAARRRALVTAARNPFFLKSFCASRSRFG
jgi:catechol 2,3-dioxygenase-like lactoylglutathione lyase family enzyme